MKFRISVKTTVKVVILLIIVSIISCKKDDKEISKINVYLTDAPALYSALNLEINSVSFLALNAKNEIVFDEVNSGNYNLLKFSNGVDTIIASTNLPSQKIYEIRVLLGTNNYIVENGIKKQLITDLTKPIIFHPDVKLENKQTLNLWLDIDVYRSIKKQQDGNIHFNPVFRFYDKEKTGSIRGIILPENARSFVSAYNETDTFGSIANEIGLYTILGITPGKYVIKFIPQRDDLLEAVVEDSIEIIGNSSPNIGTVVLN